MRYSDEILLEKYACEVLRLANPDNTGIQAVLNRLLYHCSIETAVKDVDLTEFAEGPAVREKVGQIIRVARSLQG